MFSNGYVLLSPLKLFFILSWIARVSELWYNPPKDFKVGLHTFFASAGIYIKLGFHMNLRKFLRLSYRARYPDTCMIVISIYFLTAAVMPRAVFTIPLTNISYTAPHDSVEERVSIWFDKVDEWWEVTHNVQKHIKEKDMNTEEEVFTKPSSQGLLLSPVEAQLISKICKGLIKTLEGFEHDLKNNRWDKCLYLDSYLSSFFHEFYHLYSVCHSSTNALPAVTSITDSLYDRSPESPKSDKRITAWRQTTDHVIKLRIAAKELVYQIKQWQKKELDEPEKTTWEDQSGDFVQAYELFVRLYFNLAPK